MKNLAIPWKGVFYCLCFCSASQYGLTPALAQNSGERDTSFVNTLLRQSREQLRNDPAKTISLAIQAKDLAEEINFPSGKAYALKNIGLGYYYQGKYPETLAHWNESLEIFKQLKDNIGVANLLSNIAVIYINTGDDANALEYSLQSLKLSEEAGDTLRILSALNAVGSIYAAKEATLSKALDSFLKALPLSEGFGDKEVSSTILGNIGDIYHKLGDDAKALIFFNKSIHSDNSAYAHNGLGKLFLRQGDHEKALTYHQQALAVARGNDDKLEMAHSLEGIANVYLKENKNSPALIYFQKATVIAEELRALPELKDLYEKMALTYSQTADYNAAFKYQLLYSGIKDTIYNIDTDKKLSSLQFDFDLQKKQAEINALAQDKILKDEQLKKQKYFRNGLLVGLTLVLIIAVIQWQHSRQRSKANRVLQAQKNEIEQQKEKVESVLNELKMTQSQLIQSEKMASLGELTAGIAHEIQNPLNFVNNFSEVNKELLLEMKEDIEKGNLEDVKSLAENLIDNQEKINHHGKRADAIVKSMLQHSRSSTGTKEPTDINNLANEYLRLAYHGLRAKDKSFNVTLKTSFDEGVGTANVIAQDIGRVILNLINNAFYAVAEKKKYQSTDYEPIVTVSTERRNKGVLVSVKDNGNGIPAQIKDKIFQPFFTTKPTGHGTGLGLSLSHDIIKAHGGELKLETREGQGSTFTIDLPATDKNNE